MKPHNPFPGMNPWMQNVWSDLHTRLISHISEALGLELPDDLSSRAEEAIPMQEEILQTESWRHGIAPVWTPEDDPSLADRLAVPVLVEKMMEPITPRWVEIRERDGKLITVIEITSPQNKTKSGRKQFEAKLDELLSAGVNVVEIDLIRGGIAAKDFEPQGWPTEPRRLLTASRGLNPLAWSHHQTTGIQCTATLKRRRTRVLFRLETVKVWVLPLPVSGTLVQVPGAKDELHSA
jgi:hypothetical protein